MIPWPFCCGVNSWLQGNHHSLSVDFILCLKVFTLWVLLKSKLSNTYLCETLVFLKLGYPAVLSDG